MNLKELFKKALYYISVPKCVLCKEKLDYEDRGLCKKCKKEYDRHKMRDCPKCARILSRCSCSYDKLQAHGIKEFVKIFRYSKAEQSMPSNYLIYSLKQDNRSDVLSFLSEELADAIKSSVEIDPSKLVVTNVPRRRKAIVSYGYDHAQALATSTAKILGLEYVNLLKSKSKVAQKTVYGEERMRNANFDCVCDDNLTLKGKTVILVDDIVTTGASMTNCATLIKGLGAKTVIGACLGTAYKEKYIDFDHTYGK